MSGSWALYAAKILRPELAKNPVVLESFVRERSVLLALSHPHIVPLTDMVVEGGVLALVMEFQHGGSLRQKLDSKGPLPVRLALSLIVQVLNAVEFAHRQGVMHLDIKPENVLLSGVLGSLWISRFVWLISVLLLLPALRVRGLLVRFLVLRGIWLRSVLRTVWPLRRLMFMRAR